MPIREFKLPNDVDVFVDVVKEAFHYPENENWSVQTDEVENIRDSMQTIRRLWPLLAVLRMLIPALRDMLLGYVWEEDGKVVGMTNVQRAGSSGKFTIGNVAVIPTYRRRGIARELVEACMQMARERKARQIVLEVIDGNVPAYSLYEKLGFTTYSGSSKYEYDGDGVETEALPSDYKLVETRLTDWRPRFELDRRITPLEVARFSPIEESRYRQPMLLRPFMPLLIRMMGITPHPYLLYHHDTVVGRARAAARSKAGGMNDITMWIDPDHAAMTEGVLRKLVEGVQKEAPGRRIEMEVDHWQPHIMKAAEAVGFRKQAAYHAMGMVITPPTPVG